jgi:adenine/guanine phosphoribosyltransferase-like PRPP-binding protein
LYQVGDQLHTVLRGYKDSRIESVRAKFAIQVAAFFGRFIRDHGECIREAAGENWDGLVVVPSSHGREGVHPLAAAIGLISGMELPVVDCLVATGIAVEHNKPAEAAYIATSGAQGRRVLLIDDTYTTGAHLQSAATSLSRAGAQVLAAVVIGRVMDANFNEENARLLRAARRKGFRFDGCCLEPEDG